MRRRCSGAGRCTWRLSSKAAVCPYSGWSAHRLSRRWPTSSAWTRRCSQIDGLRGGRHEASTTVSLSPSGGGSGRLPLPLFAPDGPSVARGPACLRHIHGPTSPPAHASVAQSRGTGHSAARRRGRQGALARAAMRETTPRRGATCPRQRPRSRTMGRTAARTVGGAVHATLREGFALQRRGAGCKRGRLFSTASLTACSQQLAPPL
jgi:hypothetical protein